jgi:hypothetical protein
MYFAALVFLIAVGLFFLFLAVDGLGLQAREDSGTVVGRERRDAVMGHRTEIINNRPLIVPHVTPEKYIFKLDINGHQTVRVAPRGFFDAVEP